ncbi:IS30 family transposase, partial [Pediococcus pentosaceus]|uniref:IS30 family transposase n=1 Tax=Pediococcus pentosaceus TaxID=1255 RepID=UPI00132FE7A0
TRFYYAIKMKKRNSAQFRMVMDTFMSNFDSAVKSITCDYGVEFVNRLAIGSIENACNIKVYYAHAYAPHERGSNELHNYLLREYFPKKTNFNKTSAVEILTAIKDINDRPRKMHNWKSMNFKFKRELAKNC